MKWILMLSFMITGAPVTDWLTDFETAKQVATEKNRYILLNFSGSDWCIPCMRLRKEVFDNEAFKKLADSSLVLLNADFPRNRKNQLSKERKDANDKLAEQYNSGGKFPFTVVLTAEGQIVQSWEGYLQNNAADFIQRIKSVCDAYHH